MANMLAFSFCECTSISQIEYLKLPKLQDLFGRMKKKVTFIKSVIFCVPRFTPAATSRECSANQEIQIQTVAGEGHS